MTTLATDPPVSERQRRAMFAAAVGKSNLGIPKSVGKEFSDADRGGKLPGRAKDMSDIDWRGLFNGIFKFLSEERREPEHSEDETPPKGRASSVAYITPDGYSLFVKRGPSEENWPNTWAWPGGKADDGESEEECAKRETLEELGKECKFDGISAFDKKRTPFGWDHTTYIVPTDTKFEPTLNSEHSEFKWAPMDDPPQPLHPGVKSTLDDLGKRAQDAQSDPFGKLSATTREDIDSRKHREDMPEDAFLGPNRTYPVKEKHEGEWRYTRNLLLAAARRARMQGRADIARRADGIRKREFGTAQDETQLRTTEPGGHMARKFSAGTVGWGKGTFRMSRAVKGDDERLASVGGDSALAFDRNTLRSYDKDGRLHVDSSHISKATVNPYYGAEINSVMKDVPGWKPLIDDKKYYLLRDPEELKKAVPTFNRMPILRKHVPATAMSHPKEDVIGATGSDAEFNHPYLDNSLVFWPKEAIDAIEDETQKELSCAYRYRADMTPGDYEGQHYDGVMRDIVGNHLALVKEGRAGADVMVGDSKPGVRKKMSSFKGFYPTRSPYAADAFVSEDDWSPEARKAAAEARKKNATGGGKQFASGYSRTGTAYPHSAVTKHNVGI